MATKRISAGAVCLLAAFAAAGCTAVPADYAATLSAQDPKWRSPECLQARAEAAGYDDKSLSWGTGLLLGPYGLAIAAASKEHQEKQRKLLARDLHMRCSSLPIPENLQVDTAQRSSAG